jgi:uncharacterized phage protein (TIGR02220 family)
MSSGWVKLHRKIVDTSFWRMPLVAHLAVHLIVICNHDEKELILRSGEVLTVKRGQTIASEYSLSTETGLTYQNTRTAMKCLEKCQFLTRRSTHHFTMISLANYHSYQDLLSPSNVPSNADLTQSQRRPNAPPNDKQEERIRKNEKKEEEYIPGFEPSISEPQKSIPYTQILESLNSLTGKSYRRNNKFDSLISARWNEGFREVDFEYVARVKTLEWRGTPEEKYLRPETIYGPKMDGYRNQDEKLIKRPKIGVGHVSDFKGGKW